MAEAETEEGATEMGAEAGAMGALMAEAIAAEVRAKVVVVREVEGAGATGETEVGAEVVSVAERAVVAKAEGGQRR